jgi:hypothetical protein
MRVDIYVFRMMILLQQNKKRRDPGEKCHAIVCLLMILMISPFFFPDHFRTAHLVGSRAVGKQLVKVDHIRTSRES